ncbi:hypothetical protein J437_LFUL018404 [Ladona fulva]|uniref:Reverse transcriptase n=1 Tax=Ladona fulva TaxID=123851 RepID=A0A8K0KRS1_LADFU|nr:hypothetical protein J437_LFUL018404 [Ladona fulva]
METYRYFEGIFGREKSEASEKDYDFIISKDILKDEDKEYLERDLSKAEVDAMVKSLPKYKSPGIDGLPYEFYQSYWNLIGVEIFNVLHECFNEGKLDENQRTGIIVLVQKITSPKKCNEYRPITLMTTDYKILAKIIKARLKSILEDKLEKENYTISKSSNIIDILTLIRVSRKTRLVNHRAATGGRR